MKQRSKRITVALLAVLLAAVLGAGLLVAFLPGRGRFAGDTAELTGDDFEYSYASSLAYGADTAETNGSGDVMFILQNKITIIIITKTMRRTPISRGSTTKNSKTCAPKAYPNSSSTFPRSTTGSH